MQLNYSFDQAFYATKDGYVRRGGYILIVSGIMKLAKPANLMQLKALRLETIRINTR
jgi:hypothetical protein